MFVVRPCHFGILQPICFANESAAIHLAAAFGVNDSVRPYRAPELNVELMVNDPCRVPRPRNAWKNHRACAVISPPVASSSMSNVMGIISLARRKIHSVCTDLRYGAITLKGNVASSYSHLGATGTLSSGYDVLPALFANHVRPGDVLVDVGCGKGRILNWWLDHHRDHQIYGIELDPIIAEHTRNRLKRFDNVTILTGDACALIPDNGSLFYLYNPFDASVMQRFIAALLKKPVAQNGLPRRIIYYNCVHLDLFENNRHFTTRRLDQFNRAVIDCNGN